MSMTFIGEAEVSGRIGWRQVADAIEAGHRLARAELGDQFLKRGPDVLLSRSAWIDGLGVGVKSVTVMAGNAAAGVPTVQGAMLVFEDRQGALRAIIDGPLVTYWKTAGDSVTASRRLARPESRRLMILGAGVVARSLVSAYLEVFPDLEDIAVWNRTSARAEELVSSLDGVEARLRVSTDLPGDVAAADIIASATMSKTPVLQGDWVSPGAHVDLIGAFTADMREADDALMRKASVFVDSRETTLGHIGELMIPLAEGVITEADVRGDFYDLFGSDASTGRRSSDEITLCKNGGGAHLDLMTAGALIAAAAGGA